MSARVHQPDDRVDVKFIVKRLVTWPRYREDMDDQTSSSIASEIVMHLKLSNWRFTKGAAHALALKDRA